MKGKGEKVKEQCNSGKREGWGRGKKMISLSYRIWERKSKLNFRRGGGIKNWNYIHPWLFFII